MADELDKALSAGARAARRHYKAHATADGRGCILVPEWGETPERPLAVYWKPFTLADNARCFFNRGDLIDRPKAMAKVVYHKAEDREGRQIFDQVSDEHVLLYETDQSIVARVAGAIVEAPSASDLAKALERNALRMAAFKLADILGKTIDEVEQMSLAKFNETIAFYDLQQRQEAQGA